MYFSTSCNFWMQASIEAIPEAPGALEKLGLATLVFFRLRYFKHEGEFISTRGTGAGTKVFGRKKRCLGPRTGPARPYRQKMTGASSGLFGASSQLLDASSDRGDSGGAGKLSKS